MAVPLGGLGVIRPFEQHSKKARPFVISDEATRSSAPLVKHVHELGDHSRCSPFFQFFSLLFRRTNPALFDARRKIVADGQGLTRSASRWLTLVRDKLAGGASSRFGLIAVRTCPPAMRTAPKWKRSTSWMARPTQTHLDTVNRPFGVRLRVCLRQNYGFESKVSRGRNPGSPSPPYCDVPRPRKNLSERAWVHGPFSIRIDHTEIKLEGSLSVRC